MSGERGGVASCEELKLTPAAGSTSPGSIIKEISDRLQISAQCGARLSDVGPHLPARCLAERAQRIRLATQIGSHLSGVLYVLDEPSIGLHQRDNDRLIATLKRYA